MFQSNSDVVIIKEKKSISEKIKPWILVAIPIIMVFLFTAWPFVQTIWRSTQLTDMLGKSVKGVGLRNYEELFGSSSFWNSLKVTVKFSIISVLVSTSIGFVLALLCQEYFPFRSFFRSSYSMSRALSSIGVAQIFKLMLNPNSGIFATYLGVKTNFLGNPDWALFMVAFLTGWLGSGMDFLYFSAGLSAIDPILYESASVDGAKGYQKFWYITLPQLSPITFFVLVTNVIGAFQSFGQIKVLTQGGPGQSTNTITYDIYRNAFENYRYDYASAESVILFIIVVLLTVLMFWLRRRIDNAQR